MENNKLEYYLVRISLRLKSDIILARFDDTYLNHCTVVASIDSARIFIKEQLNGISNSIEEYLYNYDDDEKTKIDQIGPDYFKLYDGFLSKIKMLEDQIDAEIFSKNNIFQIHDQYEDIQNSLDITIEELYNYNIDEFGTGEWKATGDGLVCSNCGATIAYSKKVAAFCPDCGQRKSNYESIKDDLTYKAILSSIESAQYAEDNKEKDDSVLEEPGKVKKIRPKASIVTENNGYENLYRIKFGCPKCNKQISDNDTACDKCGTFFNWNKKAKIEVETIRRIVWE